MKNIKILATVEARMNSTRLPGKVMKKLGKYNLLELLLKRVRKSKYISDVIVATTTNKKDNKIVNFLKKKKIKFFRGDENNVTKRIIQTAETFNGKMIVQLTADNPFVDPVIIDYMIKFYLKNISKFQYVTNCGFGNYDKSHVPLGFNTQIFLLKHLKNNYKYCNKKDLREHPSLYFYREGKKYKLKNLPLPKKYKTNLNIRLTVDTVEDLRLARLVFKKLNGDKNLNFGLAEIISFFKKNQSYLRINKKTIQKKVNLNT